jgi:hypothetical protein
MMGLHSLKALWAVPSCLFEMVKVSVLLNHRFSDGLFDKSLFFLFKKNGRLRRELVDLILLLQQERK